jgi:hypothetical protein
VQPPPTQYVERGRVSIAYQVVGDGPVDMLRTMRFGARLASRGAQPA